MKIMPNLQTIKKVIKAKGYRIFDDGKPYHLNIGGIRNQDSRSDRFDDLIYVFYKDDKGEEHLLYFDATTDPGLFYDKHPMNILGVGILKEGQYVGCWQKALFQGKYQALKQIGNMTLLLDNVKDGVRNYDTKVEKTGAGFGCCLHKAGKSSILVDKWSAACQVTANEVDFDKIMSLVDLSLKHRQNLFSYTLTNVKDYMI